MVRRVGAQRRIRRKPLQFKPRLVVVVQQDRLRVHLLCWIYNLTRKTNFSLWAHVLTSILLLSRNREILISNWMDSNVFVLYGWWEGLVVIIFFLCILMLHKDNSELIQQCQKWIIIQLHVEACKKNISLRCRGRTALSQRRHGNKMNGQNMKRLLLHREQLFGSRSVLWRQQENCLF